MGIQPVRTKVAGELLFISHVYGDGGGQNINVRNWANGFVQRGYKVHVLYNTQDQSEAERYESGLHLFPVYHKWSAVADLFPSISFRMMAAAQHLISSNEIDLVSFHSLYRLPASLAAWYCRLNGIPVVATSHVARTWGGDSINFAAMALGWINGHISSANTAVGPLAGTPLGKDVTTIWNSVDRELFDPESPQVAEKAGVFKKEYGLEGKAVVFCPARITPAKGQMDLLLAVEELRNNGKDFILVLAGREDPDYTENLRKYALEAGLSESLLILGMLAQKDMPSIYKAADIIALASHHAEGIPAVALEAFAMKTPFIGYDSGGTRDIVHNGQNGLLLNEHDVPSLAQGLSDLMENRPLRARIIKAASRNIESDAFTLNGVLDRLEEVFLRFISRP